MTQSTSARGRFSNLDPRYDLLMMLSAVKKIPPRKLAKGLGLNDWRVDQAIREYPIRRSFSDRWDAYPDGSKERFLLANLEWLGAKASGHYPPIETKPYLHTAWTNAGMLTKVLHKMQELKVSPHDRNGVDYCVCSVAAPWLLDVNVIHEKYRQYRA